MGELIRATSHVPSFRVPVGMEHSQQLPTGLFVIGNELKQPRGVTPRDPAPTPLVLGSTPSLIMATDGDVMEHGLPAMPEARPMRSSSEIGLALFNPGLFLARDVEDKIGVYQTFETRDVLENLRLLGEDLHVRAYLPNAMEREKHTSRYFDRMTGETAELTTTTPGALETVGLHVIDLLADPSFRGNEGVVILAPLAKLFKDYRMRVGPMLETPEMPDLIQKLTGELDRFPKSPGVRNAIYGLMEQIQIPASMQEEIALKMDKSKDLEHPLAYQLVLSIGDHNPESEWIRVQAERRSELLQVLGGSNQELFDRYDELMALSRGLVFSGDPLEITPGKVGLEIETRLKNRLLGLKELKLGDGIDLADRGIRYICASNGLDEESWHMGRDGLNFELRRAGYESSLEHDIYYADSLTHLYKWFGDYAERLLSLHMHFDNQRHPNIPLLGNLFAGTSDGLQAVVRSRRHSTWEVRGTNVPRAEGNMHPARLEDLIELYISSSDPYSEPEDVKKLAVDPDMQISLDQLIWGHIVTFNQSPRGRLAALMALHDPMALKSPNPLALINSFEGRSLQEIMPQIRKLFNYQTDIDSLKILTAVLTGDENEFKDAIGSVDSYATIDSAQKVLGEEWRPLIESAYY